MTHIQNNIMCCYIPF